MKLSFLPTPIGRAVPLGESGVTVSRVGFGVHPLGPTRRNLSVEEGAALMRYAYERGIRFFDTAQFYGTYDYLRAGLEEIRRSPLYAGEPVLCGKSLATDFDGMTAAIDEALERTGAERFDLFLLHQCTPGWREERAGALRALLQAKERGKVRAVGLSTHHEDVVREAAEAPEPDVVFALYNQAGLGIRNGDVPGSAEGMLEALRRCGNAGKGVFTMKVFGGGNLTDRYQSAARHVFEECAGTIPAAVIGFTERREVDELERLLSGLLPPDYNPPMDGKRLRVDREDCLGCGTCVRICASGAMHYSREDGLAEIDYAKCVSCSYCAIACPERAIVLW